MFKTTFEIDPIFGCHLWTGELGNHGRPIIWRGKTPVAAYRVLWERERGVITNTLRALDHVCRRVRCVNLDHLELVTKAENERRKSWAYRAARKHCRNGHALDQTRLVTPEMGILCRECERTGYAI